MEILYEDNHLLAINKRAGEIVQSDKTGDPSLIDEIKTYLIKRDNRPGDVFLVPVHRLDRPVTGVVLFARTSKALSRMNELFRSRSVKKSYLAICSTIPSPQEGKIRSYLKKNEKKNMSYIVAANTKDSKLSELEYRLVGVSSNYCLLSISLETGRHHQIRVQLSSIGSPIRGDLKYGYPRSNKDGGIDLHSRFIEFIHPVKKELIRITAPLPLSSPLWNFFEQSLSTFEMGENTK